VESRANGLALPLSDRLGEVRFCQKGCYEHMAYLDSEGLTSLVRHMAHLGATARWVSRFVPVIEPEADPRTCTPYPFAHLMIGQRQTLRQAYAALLKERVARNAPAVPIPPPRIIDTASGSARHSGITRHLHFTAGACPPELFARRLCCLGLSDTRSGAAPGTHDRGQTGVLDQWWNWFRQPHTGVTAHN
jgi:hypothetical protein